MGRRPRLGAAAGALVYHPAGLSLIDGYIELVGAGDPLADFFQFADGFGEG